MGRRVLPRVFGNVSFFDSLFLSLPFFLPLFPIFVVRCPWKRASNYVGSHTIIRSPSSRSFALWRFNVSTPPVEEHIDNSVENLSNIMHWMPQCTARVLTSLLNCVAKALDASITSLGFKWSSFVVKRETWNKHLNFTLDYFTLFNELPFDLF